MDFFAMIFEDLLDVLSVKFDFISNTMVRTICQISVMILCCLCLIGMFLIFNKITNFIINQFDIENIIVKIILKVISGIVSFLMFSLVVLIIK